MQPRMTQCELMVEFHQGMRDPELQLRRSIVDYDRRGAQHNKATNATQSVLKNAIHMTPGLPVGNDALV